MVKVYDFYTGDEAIAHLYRMAQAPPGQFEPWQLEIPIGQHYIRLAVPPKEVTDHFGLPEGSPILIFLEVLEPVNGDMRRRLGDRPEVRCVKGWSVAAMEGEGPAIGYMHNAHLLMSKEQFKQVKDNGWEANDRILAAVYRYHVKRVREL